MRAAVAGAAALALGMSLAGCSSNTAATTEQPTCTGGSHDSASHAVILMAQSVPSADWIPCLKTTLPLGWSFEHLDARNDISRFYLNSDRAGPMAIEVRLTRSCATTGSTEIPSDREGMRRLERVTMTTPRFEGRRYYVFEGGCITFVFRLGGDSDNRGEPLALATQAVGAVSRADLLQQVHDDSEGRLSLDPPAAGGR